MSTAFLHLTYRTQFWIRRLLNTLASWQLNDLCHVFFSLQDIPYVTASLISRVIKPLLLFFSEKLGYAEHCITDRGFRSGCFSSTDVRNMRLLQFLSAGNPGSFLISYQLLCVSESKAEHGAVMVSLHDLKKCSMLISGIKCIFLQTQDDHRCLFCTSNILRTCIF